MGEQRTRRDLLRGAGLAGAGLLLGTSAACSDKRQTIVNVRQGRTLPDVAFAGLRDDGEVMLLRTVRGEHTGALHAFDRRTGDRRELVNAQQGRHTTPLAIVGETIYLSRARGGTKELHTVDSTGQALAPPQTFRHTAYDFVGMTQDRSGLLALARITQAEPGTAEHTHDKLLHFAGGRPTPTTLLQASTIKLSGRREGEPTLAVTGEGQRLPGAPFIAHEVHKIHPDGTLERTRALDTSSIVHASVSDGIIGYQKTNGEFFVRNHEDQLRAMRLPFDYDYGELYGATPDLSSALVLVNFRIQRGVDNCDGTRTLFNVTPHGDRLWLVNCQLDTLPQGAVAGNIAWTLGDFTDGPGVKLYKSVPGDIGFDTPHTFEAARVVGAYGNTTLVNVEDVGGSRPYAVLIKEGDIRAPLTASHGRAQGQLMSGNGRRALFATEEGILIDYDMGAPPGQAREPINFVTSQFTPGQAELYSHNGDVLAYTIGDDTHELRAWQRTGTNGGRHHIGLAEGFDIQVEAISRDESTVVAYVDRGHEVTLEQHTLDLDTQRGSEVQAASSIRFE